jgi:Flp pilus assembly protein TadD
MGDLAGALEDFNKCITLEPTDPKWYESRADYWKEHGRRDLADVDRSHARILRTPKTNGVDQIIKKKAG